jgi:D-alanyl-lipoteichoic acid acyltransferase DltB (MBOAT superfamily)
VSWKIGLLIEELKSPANKKYLMATGIIVILFPLLFFKYYNFINESIYWFFNLLSIPYNIPQINILLPVGISFFTFRTLSYVVDVYKGKISAEKKILNVSLYIAFFPQLLAGPIERAPNLLPQFYKNQIFDYEGCISGLRLVLWGVFKKIIIADRCAILVNQIYNNPHSYSGYPLILATYFFAFQIYCDFSGYTDMARGIARMLGFESMENFKRPYFAKSIQEFWRRWHISLSTWFRDYVYIPLGGSRVSLPRYYFNLLIVFTVSGLWHGAGWTFIFWGFLHGFYMIFSSITSSVRKKITGALFFYKIDIIKNIIKIFITFHLVCLGWIFFRANSFLDAIYILRHFFAPLKQPLADIPLGLDIFQIIFALMAIFVMIGVEILCEKERLMLLWKKQKRIVRWAIYAVLVILCINFKAAVKSGFIYLQF